MFNRASEPKGRAMRGDRVRARREQLGMTQIELAGKVGLRDQAISNIEHGKQSPNAESLTLLADSLQCSADWLLGRTDEPGGYATMADLDNQELQLITAYRAGNMVEIIMDMAARLARDREGQDPPNAEAIIHPPPNIIGQ